MTTARPAFQIPFDVQLPPQQTDWEDLAQAWAAAEALGFVTERGRGATHVFR